MIPLHKLAKLPFSQGLRKTARIFEEAERGFLLKGLPKETYGYLSDLLGLWISDESIYPREPVSKSLPLNVKKALDQVREVLIRAASADSSFDTNEIRRGLNTIHYLLLQECGQYPADWDFQTTDFSGALDPDKRKVFPGMEVYLEDIRSPFNVGSMFRSAESFGVEKIYISPFCADPRHKRAQRTAMGCLSILPWTRFGENPFEDPENSFPPGTAFFALETGGTKLDEFHFPCRAVMIAGSEELGVSPAALAAADASLGRVSIPTFGAKGSLNVSIAFGIVLHAWAASLDGRLVSDI